MPQESKISLTDLEADIALEAGDGATGLLCIRECLDSDAMNNTMGTLFAGSRTDPPTNPLDSSMRVSPYKDIGPYFKVNMYPDNDNSGDKSGISGQEDRLPAGAHNWIGGTVVGDAATYTVTDSGGGVKKLRDVLAGVGKYLDYSNANKTLLDGRKHGDNLRNYRYWSKPTSYSYDNYSRNMGWAFNMTTVIDSDTNKGALLCEPDGSGNVRGYYDRIKTEASSGGVAVFGHAAGTNAYYCDYRMWDGSVGTIYEIRIKQMPDYVLSSAGSIVSVTAPKKLELTVPDSGVTYNFAPANTQPLAGKKYKLKFEGFGELHNLPGRVIDMDLYPNGDFDKGRYVDQWKASYRYIHEFIIPDGTVLINSSGENIKVRALKGDEYLLKLGSIPAGVAYTKTSTDLPEISNIQNLAEGANSIGNVLSTTLPSAGSDDPSVIHGKTVYPPPAN